MTALKFLSPNNTHRSGFTLIELLVVILTLNPAELLRQSRDSNRVADMGTLTTAFGIFSEDQSSGSLGSANTVYVSIPDPTATSTLGDQCQGLGLPALPSAYNYHCAASSTYRNINGTGWIPVNFSSVSLGSPLGSLPIDPINTSSSRNYYTYTTNTTQYEVTSAMESSKYKLGGSNDVVGPDGSTLSTVYAKGSNLSLEPLDYGDTSLVGLWSFNEGTGTVAYDYSGNGYSGTNIGATYTTGKISPYALQFYGGTYTSATSSYITLSSSTILDPSVFTISAWLYSSNPGAGYNFIYSNARDCCGNYNGINFSTVTSQVILNIWNGGSSPAQVNGGNIPTNTWTLVTGTYDGATMKVYMNGVLVSSGGYTGGVGTPASFTTTLGALSNGPSVYGFIGKLDDVRIYTRALSASEITAMYAGGK